LQRLPKKTNLNLFSPNKIQNIFVWLSKKLKMQNIQELGQSQWISLQANATHSLLAVLSFHCDSNNCFTIGAPASFIRFVAADVKFINFIFANLADCAAPALLQPAPGSVVATMT